MSPEVAKSLAGRRVILVEDEILVALLLEDMLEEIGCQVVGVASSVEEALALAATADAEVALLDVNIAGELVYPVAERLQERCIPIVFSTGYESSALPERWRSCPILNKPYGVKQLKSALSSTLEHA